MTVCFMFFRAGGVPAAILAILRQSGGRLRLRLRLVTSQGTARALT